MKKIVEKSLFDTQNTIICDYAWKPKIEIAPALKSIKMDMKTISMNISAMRQKALVSQNDNLTESLPNFRKPKNF